MKLRRYLTIVTTLCLLSGAGCDREDRTVLFKTGPRFGVVVLNGGWIGIIDGTTRTVVAPLLTGELGTDILDVAIARDGKTTLVSSFGDRKVCFIDTSDPALPVVSGSLTLSFFAEDIAITPNGCHALVTGGAAENKIAVIDMVQHTLVEEFNDPTLKHAAVATDGATVLTVDYFGGTVNAFTLAADGHLTQVSSTDVSNGGKRRLLNIAIAPDGKTAIVACHSTLAADMAFPVLAISGPGQVTAPDMVRPGINLVGAQSIVFNRAGTKAYLNCVQEYIAPVPEPSPPVYPPNVIMVLDITAPGQARDAGTPIELDFVSRNQWFGVDTLAMDDWEGTLYVSNMNSWEAKNHMQVLDVATGSVVGTLAFASVPLGAPPVDKAALPAGVSFWSPWR